MDNQRRGEPRIQLNSLALVQTLGESAETNGRPIEARVVERNSKGFKLHSGTRLNAGSVVRVDVDDAMFLGEVCYCFPDPNQAFDIGVLTEQSLASLSALPLVKRLHQR
jgi:hypothetical protein